MEVIELEKEDSRWEEFLRNNTHLVFHTPQYKKFIEEAFGCKYKVLGVVDDGVRLIFPMVEVKSWLFGRRIISSAYIEYGGFAGEEKYVADMLNYLNQNYSNYDYLEIRGGMESKFDLSSLIKKDWYKRFVLKLFSEDETWRNIQESKRKAVKKALKEVSVKDVTEIKELYELYCQNMRRFGSPPYSKKYFESFYTNLVSCGLAKIIGSYYQGKLVSALLGFCYKERVHILIAVSDPKYQEYRPNDAMHWEFIKWACNNNYKWFDFGRVREASGQFEYKQKWGPEMLDLPSYFLLWQSKDVPLVDPKSHKLLVKVWQKMPMVVTKVVGGRLRKGLGI